MSKDTRNKFGKKRQNLAQNHAWIKEKKYIQRKRTKLKNKLKRKTAYENKKKNELNAKNNRKKHKKNQ